MEKTIKKHLPFIRFWAKKLVNDRSLNIEYYEDLVQSGVIGLLQAKNKFDESKDIKFKTYAEHRIKGEMEDFLRGYDKFSRSNRKKIKEREKNISLFYDEYHRYPTTEEMSIVFNISEKDYIEKYHRLTEIEILDINDYAENIEDEAKAIEKLNYLSVVDVVSKYIEKLNDREKKVIKMYYYEDKTLQEIGDHFSFSKEYARQQHDSAIDKLKRMFRREKISDYFY